MSAVDEIMIFIGDVSLGAGEQGVPVTPSVSTTPSARQ